MRLVKANFQVFSIAIIIVLMGLIALTALRLTTIPSLVLQPLSLFQSPVFLAIISTFVSAFAGTYGAQFLAEKNRLKESLLTEVRTTNAAIMLGFGIANTYLNLKSQHVKKLKEDHSRELAIAEAWAARRYMSGIDEPHVTTMDLQLLQPPSAPTAILQNLIFEKISSNGRIIALAAELHQTIDYLTTSIRRRNELIENRRTDATDDDAGGFYFGFPNRVGQVDLSYPSVLDAIYQQTNDCIFFSILLCNDLKAHGEKLLSGKGLAGVKINKVDFSGPIQKGLVPDKAPYESWYTNF